jgi:hypothetical protein
LGAMSHKQLPSSLEELRGVRKMFPRKVLEELFSNYNKAIVKGDQVRFENDNWFEEIPLTDEVMKFIKEKGMRIVYEK